MYSPTPELHNRSLRPAEEPLPYDWEEIGPGIAGPAFGHWDIIHQIMDTVADNPRHAYQQVINNLHNMTEDGFLPGSIWFKDDQPQRYHWEWRAPILRYGP